MFGGLIFGILRFAVNALLGSREANLILNLKKELKNTTF